MSTLQVIGWVMLWMFITGWIARFAIAWRRRRWTKAAGKPIRAARGISVTLLMSDIPTRTGLKAGRPHVLRVDMVLGENGLAVALGRGPLLQITKERGRTPDSARCPGPGRLVVEGSIPKPSGQVGHWRMDAAVPDAKEWVDALNAWMAQR